MQNNTAWGWGLVWIIDTSPRNSTPRSYTLLLGEDLGVESLSNTTSQNFVIGPSASFAIKEWFCTQPKIIVPR